MNKGREMGAWAKLLCFIWVDNQYNLTQVGIFLVSLFGKETDLISVSFIQIFFFILIQKDKLLNCSKVIVKAVSTDRLTNDS